MCLDLLIRNARVPDRHTIVDIAVSNGVVVAMEPDFRCDEVREEVDAEGRLAFGGFVDCHIHLDKACILDRCSICEGTLAEAVRETARAKAGFTEEDVWHRAAAVVEKAIVHGTTRMRTFVEVDPRAGTRSFEAIKRIRADYAFAIDIEICVFAQEGLTQEMQTYQMLDEALRNGADLVGGCPYTDPDPSGHVSLIFDLAERHGVAVDFHLDFSLDPTRTDLPAVLHETRRRGYQGRVAIGHVTNLSALPTDSVREIAAALAEGGIALVVLPATDLFLGGRDSSCLVPRGVAPAGLLAGQGVTVAAATNNILNPFTPYGDASLIRMANLYANVAQISRDQDLRDAFDMVSSGAARLMDPRRPYGIAIGHRADIVLLDTNDLAAAVREIAPVLCGWKNGRKSFANARPVIFTPQ